MGDDTGPSIEGPIVRAHTDLASPYGTFSVWHPEWIRDHCTTRTWAILGRAAPVVRLVVATTNLGSVRARPVQGLFGFYLNQRVASGRPSSGRPFGTVTAFDAQGSVVATSLLSSRLVRPRNLCPKSEP